MEKLIRLTLLRTEAGQVIDGLEVRREAWARTADYFQMGETAGEIEECTDLREAEVLEKTYADIIAKIRKQIAEQLSCG